MRSLLVFLCFNFFFIINSAANFVDLKIQIDSSYFGKANFFEFELYIIKENGSQIHLSVLEPGFKWRNVTVEGENIISFKDGKVVFNQANISSLNNKMLMNISYRQNEKFIQKNFIVELPYVQSLIVQNERLKYNEKTFLNYKLVFNNNKISEKNDNLFLIENIYTDFNQIAQISNGLIYVFTDKEIEGNYLLIILKNRLSNDILAEKKIKLEYSNSCNIIALGLAGRDGKTGNSTNVISANGEQGTNGEHGSDAPDLKIFIKKDSSDSNVFFGLKSFKSNGLIQKDFILFNDSTKIVIESIGGKGGNGGNGGKGGYGTENSIYGGNGGNGGDAGNGGDSGRITIYLEEEAKIIIDKITIKNKGGSSGLPGKGGGNGSGYSSSILTLIKNYNDGKLGIDGNVGSKGNGEKETKIQFLSKKEFEEELNRSTKFN